MQTESSPHELDNEPDAAPPNALPELTEDDKFALQWLRDRAPMMQDENGIDLEHIRENLKRTPRERLERAEKMANWILLCGPKTHETENKMPNVPMEFLRFLKMLRENEIDFVLVGGLAMVVQGTDTVTQDLDIFSGNAGFAGPRQVFEFENRFRPD